MMRWRLHTAVLVSCFAVSGSVNAQAPLPPSATVPHQFERFDPVSASKLNENFDSLSDRLAELLELSDLSGEQTEVLNSLDARLNDLEVLVFDMQARVQRTEEALRSDLENLVDDFQTRVQRTEATLRKDLVSLVNDLQVRAQSTEEKIAQRTEEALRVAQRTEEALRVLPDLARAVVSFDSPDGCPEGWVEFQDAAGRVIVGQGSSKDLSPRRYREIDGEEEHALAIAEMPAHTHPVRRDFDNPPDFLGGSTAGFGVAENGNNGDRVNVVGAAGGSRPHNNMQPYIVLVFCRLGR